MTIPMTPVMNPPARNEILLGERWEKSFAGETTLAAMFVASVAMHRASIATMRTAGEDVARRVGDQLPRHHDDPYDSRDESTGPERDPPRGKVGEVVRRRTTS